MQSDETEQKPPQVGGGALGSIANALVDDMPTPVVTALTKMSMFFQFTETPVLFMTRTLGGCY